MDALVRRIQKEKKQVFIKQKQIEAGNVRKITES